MKRLNCFCAYHMQHTCFARQSAVCLALEKIATLLCRPSLTSPIFCTRSPLGWWASSQSPSKGQRNTVSILCVVSKGCQAGTACQLCVGYGLGVAALISSCLVAAQQAAIVKQLMLRGGPCPRCILCSKIDGGMVSLLWCCSSPFAKLSSSSSVSAVMYHVLSSSPAGSNMDMLKPHHIMAA